MAIGLHCACPEASHFVISFDAHGFEMSSGLKGTVCTKLHQLALTAQSELNRFHSLLIGAISRLIDSTTEKR
jgi:hypothetical protein